MQEKKILLKEKAFEIERQIHWKQNLKLEQEKRLIELSQRKKMNNPRK